MNPPKKNSNKNKRALYLLFILFGYDQKRPNYLFAKFSVCQIQYLTVANIYFITLVFVFIVFVLNRKASKVLNHQLRQWCVNSLLFNY